MNYLLSIIIFFPAFAAVILYVLKGEKGRVFAIIVAALELLFVLLLWSEFNINYGGIQFYSHIEIIHSFGVAYAVGVDGISLFLITLNALLTLFALSLFKYIKTSIAIAVLFLESIIMGVFSALDVMLFYIFWEFSLLPVLYLLGIWGGEKRIYAAIKYFVYAFGGSIIMLVGILYFAYQYKLFMGVWSFNLLDWYQISFNTQLQKWLFLAFFIGMAVKIPLFPLHSWQPHTYTQAPMIGSALLSGVVSKMGTYGLLRFVLPLFPDASSWATLVVSIICVGMVVYGAMLSLVQKDAKTLLAYGSISHMGIIVLGLFSLNTEGLSGAVFFMISHGLVVATLFFLVGAVYERTQTQQISQIQGLAHSMPRLSSTFGIVMMCSLGLPLTMGFVGEVLCLYGIFQVNPIIAFLAGSSFFVGAIYMLVLFKRVFLGNISPTHSTLKDFNLREKIVFAPIVAIIICFGVYPKPLLNPISTSVQTLLPILTPTNPSTTTERNKMGEQNIFIYKSAPDDFDEGVLVIPNIGD
ncbi:NADH-quinone oxidoreductase subunit M [Helicobacter typhlonius]|uniref:NADH-quinone oxidoreductase subunit M n=5 Tax=Helicobacter typhlonius TaxID=76936 RepID=A0A099UIG3_9HELI|nr:NADH-quinone oxidoreductase subunit M [Helicobacter typhlonius]TLD78459.1 NADH-quinone oxidoreductase subunit M [Helicobacter typhlonius]CUU39704.1 NADH-ubiquinone oxidoreductase chain M [Helicobacter typhlonius]HCD73543.1 NADH-quinone oxidoreductase subunit M [Helicobacter sp.]